MTVLEYTQEQHLHPTQKPVALLEYLIRTYTNPGDVVLDPCMGSGSTGAACLQTNRGFIGIELDGGFYQTARERLATAAAQDSLFVESREGWQVNDGLR